VEVSQLTTVIAWRDPFCLISDDAETDPETGTLGSVGPKIFRVSPTLACATSGIAVMAAEFRERLAPILAARDWADAETEFRAAVLDTSETHGLLMRAVLAGTIGGVAGIAEFPPAANDAAGQPGTAVLNPYAALGTGAFVALVARSIASRMDPRPEGEELLRLMALAAVDTDRNSALPIWRLDLGTPSDAPAYKWLESEVVTRSPNGQRAD
jgi:hypothetical protein